MWQKIKKVDPRLLFVLFFLGVIFDTFFFKTYMKTFTQLIFALVGALGTDIALNYIRHRKFIFPLSGLVSSCGTFILIASPFNWPFFAMGFASIWSKHFITLKGRHIFNPVNFGAMMCLFYLQDIVQNGGSSWSGNYFMIPYLSILGALLVWRANSLALCLSYIASFLIVHFGFLAPHLPVNIASFSAPPFMLFIFFMISDPGTTPRKISSQIIFGSSVAIVEGFFKINRILNGGIWALAIVCLAWAILAYVLKQDRKPGWTTQPA